LVFSFEHETDPNRTVNQGRTRVFGARENQGVLPFLFAVKANFWLAFCSPPFSIKFPK